MMSQSNTSHIEFTQTLYSGGELVAGQPAQIAITLRRTGNLDGFDEVQIIPTDGEAQQWSDFVLNNEVVQFNPGETSKTVVLEVMPDGVMEGTEAIAFELIGVADTLIGAQSTATVEIADADVPYIEFSQAVFEVNEPDSFMPGEPNQVLVTLTRSGPLDRFAEVDLQWTGGTAEEFNDYGTLTPFPTRVFFEPWQRTQTVAIDIFPDGDLEGIETIDLELIPTFGDTAVGAQSTASVAIFDDRAAYVEFTQAQYQVNEESPNQVEITLTRSGQVDISAEVEVSITGGTATADEDYATLFPQYVYFAPGETTQTLTVDVFSDMEVEGLETVTFELTVPNTGFSETAVGTQSTATLSIIDAQTPTVEFAQTAYRGSEDNSPGEIEVTLTRSGDLNQAAEVNLFVQGGDAILGEDYHIHPFGANPIFFAPGQITQTVFVEILDDNRAEFSETAILALEGIGDTVIGVNQSTTVTIDDNDLSTVQFGQATYSVNEFVPDGPAQAVLTLTRSGNLDRFDEVEVIAIDGFGDELAQPGMDFNPIMQLIQFNPGESSKSVVLDITPDGIPEGTEIVNFVLAGVGSTVIGGQQDATLSIQDADVPTIEFTQAVFEVSEPNSFMSGEANQVLVTLTRSGALDRPAEVDLQWTGGTAEEFSDYGTPTPFPTRVFFEPWQRTQTIAIDIFPDGEVEGTETIDLELISTFGDTAVGGQRTARVDILDDKAAYVEFAQAHYQVNEDDPNQVEITLTRSGQTNISAEVEVSITGGTATGFEDYAEVFPQNVYFAPGETTQTLIVDVFPDMEVEGLESLNFELTVPNTGFSQTAIGTQATTTLSIIDAQTPTVEFAQTAYRGSEKDGPGEIEITLTRSGDLDQSAEVNLLVQGGDAILGEDYYFQPFGTTPIFFAPGQITQTVFVEILDDNRAEFSETAILALEGIGNTDIGVNQSTTVTIEDNDLSTVQFGQATYSVNEFAPDGPAQAVLTLTRSGNLDRFDEVEVIAIEGFGDDAAQPGMDFTPMMQLIQFNPGESSKSVVLDITPDGMPEGTEAVNFVLAGVGNTVIGAQQDATLAISDADVPYIEFAQAVFEVNEPDSRMPGEPNQVLVTLTRSGALDRPAEVDLQWTGGTAEEFTDYGTSTPLPTRVFFDPWQRTQTVAIDIFSDGELEGIETIDLELISSVGDTVVGAQATASVAIFDDRAAYVEFAQAQYQRNEDNFNQVEITLTRSGQLDIPAEVDVSITGGTATGDEDYVATFPERVYFAPGETTQTIIVDVFPDMDVEELETVTFELSVPETGFSETAVGHQATATLSIIDAQTPTVEFAQTVYRGSEDDGPGGIIEVTLTRSGDLNQAAEVNLLIQGGDAILGEDYYLQPFAMNPIAFAPGQTTQTVFIEIMDDNRAEFSETAILALEGVGNTAIGVNQSATVTIEDNDLSTVQFGQATYSVNEFAPDGPAQAVLTLTRSGNLDRFDEVEVIPFEGFGDEVAQPGIDFNPMTQFVQFNPGESSKSIVLDITPDGIPEGTETINFALAGVGNTVIGGQHDATLAIQDADVPTIEFAQAVFEVTEPNSLMPGGSNQVLVTLTRTGVLDQPAEVDLQWTGGTAEEFTDYVTPTPLPTRVFFDPWQRTQTVAIDIFPDGELEGIETIDLELIPSFGNTAVGPQSTASVAILDDGVAYIEFAQAQYQVNEDGPDRVEVTVTRRGQLDIPAEAEVSVTGGTATADEDYIGFFPQGVYFAPGETTQTLFLDVFPDMEVEGLETITVELSTPDTGFSETAVGTQSTATVSIIDAQTPTVEFAQTSYQGSENDGPGGIEVTLTRSGDLSQEAEVNLLVQGGDAILGEDYLVHPFGANPIFFAPGQVTQTVFIDILDDNRAEFVETAILALEGIGKTDIGLNQTAAIAIQDNDIATVQFDQVHYSINESTGQAAQVTLTLTRTDNIDRFDEVELVAADGSAQPGVDFSPVMPLVQFLPGEASKSVVLDIAPDGLFEGTESVTFALDGVGGTLVGEQHQATLVIIDPGSSAADTLMGSETDDVIKGNNGDDTIYGLGGNDKLDGNNQNDVIDGGAGNDVIRAGNGNDDIRGGSGNDKLYGHKGNDLIRGDEGNDLLVGGPGRDVMKGGAGNDRYVVDNVGDAVAETVNGGTDEVRSYTSWSLSSFVENLTLLRSASIDGVGNDSDNVLQGNKGANQLQGLAGNDSLKGMNGNDTMIGVDVASLTPGRAEIDTLNGGKNADLFVLGDSNHVFYDDGDSTSQGLGDYASIVDFKTSQQDRIQLNGSANDYRIADSPLGSGGKAIFRQVAGEDDELIAVVKGTSNLDLNGSAFSFV